MQDFLNMLLDKYDIFLVMVCANIMLSSFSAVLDKIKDKTSTDLDDKASSFLHTYLPKFQTLIDWLTGNRPH